MFEGKTIQERLKIMITTKNNKEALIFARFIEEGNVNKAIKIIEQANKEGILPLSDKTFEILQQKHPRFSEASDDILLKEKSQEVHPVIYRSINSKIVNDATKKTRRAAGL